MSNMPNYHLAVKIKEEREEKKASVNPTYTFNRIDYIDLLKGITIFCIIWFHVSYDDLGNEWSFGQIGNIFFFIMSGFFFKPTLDFKSFLKKRTITLLVPFLFFYFASIPFRFFLDYWDYHTLEAFDWGRVLELFLIEAKSDYLTLNVPIWFLLTLFVIQFISNYVFLLPKTIIAIFILSTFIFKDILSNWPTIFMLNNALCWFGYFAIGYLLGRFILNKLQSKQEKVKIFIYFLVGFIISYLYIDIFNLNFLKSIILPLRHISFFFVFLTALSFLPYFRYNGILKYAGNNSLIILGCHMWFLIPLIRINHSLFHLEDPIRGFVVSIMCLLLTIPVIYILNKHTPFLIGKLKKAPDQIQLVNKI